VENGQRLPTQDYLASVDDVLKTGGLFERLLVGLASMDQAPVWLYRRRSACMLAWRGLRPGQESGLRSGPSG
jgi:hypothetical protein